MGGSWEEDSKKEVEKLKVGVERGEDDTGGFQFGKEG
jgi:hypothetical protein